jgi:hypothetical protein
LTARGKTVSVLAEGNNLDGIGSLVKGGIGESYEISEGFGE